MDIYEFNIHHPLSPSPRKLFKNHMAQSVHY